MWSQDPPEAQPKLYPMRSDTASAEPQQQHSGSGDPSRQREDGAVSSTVGSGLRPANPNYCYNEQKDGLPCADGAPVIGEQAETLVEQSAKHAVSFNTPGRPHGGEGGVAAAKQGVGEVNGCTADTVPANGALLRDDGAVAHHLPVAPLQAGVVEPPQAVPAGSEAAAVSSNGRPADLRANMPLARNSGAGTGPSNGATPTVAKMGNSHAAPQATAAGEEVMFTSAQLQHSFESYDACNQTSGISPAS